MESRANFRFHPVFIYIEKRKNYDRKDMSHI